MGIPSEILWEWDGNENSLPTATLADSTDGSRGPQNLSKIVIRSIGGVHRMSNIAIGGLPVTKVVNRWNNRLSESRTCI